MSFIKGITGFFSLNDEEDEEEQPHDGAPQEKRNVVPFANSPRRAATGTEVAVFAPRGFADVTEIADALRARRVVIVNLQGADRSLLQRVVDFTSGVAYTIDGRIQKLAEAIYLVVPAGVAVNSTLKEIENDGLVDFGIPSKPHFGAGGATQFGSRG
jgi:cell division inhibitor SepF